MDEKDAAVIAACRERGIDPAIRLRRCPTCGAKEYLDRGRLMVEPCNVETHAGQKVQDPADVPLPRRTADRPEHLNDLFNR